MRSTTIICVFIIALTGAVRASDNTPEAVIAKHLDSIGTAEARSAIKTCAIQGPLHFRDLRGGTADQVGYWALVSEQRTSNFVMKFGSGEWRGERFVFDGNKTDFAVFTSSRRPSPFGDFVRWQDFILKEGLLGGELSTAWALANLDSSRARLSYVGVSKIDGRDLEGIEYRSKSSDMTVKIYFDPETHHHVMTLYSLQWNPGMPSTPYASAGQLPIRYTIEERFSDFQTDNGITLPRHYDLRFTRDIQSGLARLYDWDMTADKVLSNITLDPQNFQIK